MRCLFIGRPGANKGEQRPCIKAIGLTGACNPVSQSKVRCGRRPPYPLADILDAESVSTLEACPVLRVIGIVLMRARRHFDFGRGGLLMLECRMSARAAIHDHE